MTGQNLLHLINQAASGDLNTASVSPQLSLQVLKYCLTDNPDAAAELLRRQENKQLVVMELLAWASRDDTRVPEIQTLLDAMNTIGEDECLIHAMYEAQPNKRAMALLAGKGDIERVKRTIELAHHYGYGVQSLNAEGSTMQNPRLVFAGFDGNTPAQFMQRLGSQAVLKAALHEGHSELSQYLLRKYVESGLEIDLIAFGSMHNGIRQAALRGDVASIRKISEIAESLTYCDDQICSTGRMTLRECINHYGSLGANSDEKLTELKGTLIWYHSKMRDGVPLSSIGIALLNGHVEVVEALAELAQGSTEAQVNFMLISNLWVEKLDKSIVDRKDSGEQFILPVDDFEEHLAHLLPIVRRYQQQHRSSKNNVPEVNQIRQESSPEKRSDIAAELLPILERIVRVEGTNVTALGWAEKLTAVFSTAEDAKEFIGNAVNWLVDNNQNLAIWGPRLSTLTTTWPEMVSARSGYDCPISAALDFKLPEGNYNRESWASLMKEIPEALRYVSQADKLDHFMGERGISFPTSLETLREMVYTYSIEKLGIKVALPGEYSDTQHTKPDSARSFLSAYPVGAFMHIAIEPGKSACLDNLTFTGALKNTAVTAGSGYERGNEFRQVPVVVSPEKGSAELSWEMNGQYFDYDSATALWNTETIDVFLGRQNDGDLRLLCEALVETNAILAEPQVKVSFNLRNLTDKQRLELKKQLIILTVAFGVDPEVLFGDNYSSVHDLETGKVTSRKNTNNPETHLEAIRLLNRVESDHQIPRLVANSPIQSDSGEINFVVALSGDPRQAIPLVTAADTLVAFADGLLGSNDGNATIDVPPDFREIFQVILPLFAKAKPELHQMPTIFKGDILDMARYISGEGQSR